MPETLVAILTGAGLAGAAGHRAFVPAFLLGLLHQLAAGMAGASGEPFFALGDSFAWLSHPAVLVVLGGLTVLEYVAEANPDIPELTEWALRAPKMVSGFLVVAATVGSVDGNLMLLVGSGVLGAGTALGVDKIRSSVKRLVDEPLRDASDGASTKTMAVAETGWSVGMTVVAIVAPVLVLAGAVVLFLAWKGGGAAAKARKVPCPSCGESCHPEATACPHCRAAIPHAG
jgi:hypothetical protein